MEKSKLFSKGDVILTSPHEGFWGIAVVLSERNKTPQFCAMCHIAITPLIFQKEIEFSKIDFTDLVPLEFEYEYTLELQKKKPKDFKTFSKIKTCIGIYTKTNKANFAIIGKINPEIVYNGPLPFEPVYGSGATFPFCGTVNEHLGYEAYINWKRKNL